MIPNRLSIHCTDNIKETKDNLWALGLDRFYEQRAFPNLSMALQALNQATQHGFYYVVMRNFESCPDKVTIDEHFDVDILCSDYFAAKRILDVDAGVALNHHTMYENGGYTVLNYVQIGGQRVLFDLRFVGDNYYDIELQKAMLGMRVLHPQQFFIPHQTVWLYSILYHALVHKKHISTTYLEHFKSAGLITHIESGDNADQRAVLFSHLSDFMSANGFTYVTPHDKSVGFQLFFMTG
jgi:hypothetical protein